MWMSLCFVPKKLLRVLTQGNKGYLLSEPSESNVPNEPMEALLRISQDMARVLD